MILFNLHKNSNVLCFTDEETSSENVSNVLKVICLVGSELWFRLWS